MQYTVYNILYIMYSIQYTVYSIQYSVSPSENLLTCGINLFSIKIEVVLFSQLGRPVINEEILQAAKEDSNILHAIK